VSGLDFSKVKSYNLDEYYPIDPENDQSYHYFMDTNLFKHINIDPANVHVPSGNAEDIEAVCDEYEKMINEAGGIDIQVLGIGNNGHIGFNEPADAYDAKTHLVDLQESTIKANKRFFPNEDVPCQAYTMGIKTIMQAKKVLVVVSGADKAEIVKKAFFGPVTPQVPASILQLHSDVVLVADEAALSLVEA
jgi:glucosamine-6-phosphate deaminase